MNEIQHISVEKHGSVFVTINPPFEPVPSKIVGRWKHEHPLWLQAIRAQSEIPLIQNKRGISFAGAWMKYGFHEDGFTAGLRVAAALAKVGSTKVDGHATGYAEKADIEHLPREPFEILLAERIVDRYPWLSSTFDFLETSGLRALVGMVFCWILGMLRLVLGAAGVDLHMLEDELREDGKRKLAPVTGLVH